MALKVFGINYQTAPLLLREKLAFHGEAIDFLLQRLIENGVADEALLLSTCNRTELYCAVEDSFPISKWLARQANLSPVEIASFSYTYSEDAAVKHLMRVASGLNSMILGEAEILGQIKSAFHRATHVGSIGKTLGRLFQTAFSVAKQVRSQTGISVNPISVAGTAVRLAEEALIDLKQASILLVGAGDLIRLITIQLKRMGVSKITLANRSLMNAERLALEFEADSVGLDKIPECLKQADLVMTGTNSPLPILDRSLVQSALKYRKDRKEKKNPLLMIDLAVPRNIEPSVGKLPGLSLYCIDDLQMISQENRKKREKAIQEAEFIIQQEAETFMQWIRAQNSLGTLKAFRSKFENLRDQVVLRSLTKLKAGKPAELVLQRAIHTITNQILHTPTQRIRKAGFGGDEHILKLTRELFELNHEIIDTN